MSNEKKLISIHELDEFIESDESLADSVASARRILEMSDEELEKEIERHRENEQKSSISDKTPHTTVDHFFKQGALNKLLRKGD